MGNNPFKDWKPIDAERFNAKNSRVKIAASEPAKGSKQLEAGPGGIQEEISDWLKSQCHQAWFDLKRYDMPTTSRKGIPDFVGVFAGVAFGVEVKRPGFKPTVEQLGELAWMRKAGAKTAVVFSKAEAIQFFQSIREIDGTRLWTAGNSPN